MLFDLDGVIVKSEPVWQRVVEEAGVKFRGSPVTREEFEPTFGQGTVADIAVFKLNCTPQELDAFYIEGLKRHADLVWVNPDARPCLQALHANGRPLSIVTNSVAKIARQLLDAAGVRELFDFVATADQVVHAKPAPDLVLLACRQLGVDPTKAVMVGDSRYDRGAAMAAGAKFIGYGIDGDARVQRLTDVPAVVDGFEA